MVTQQDTHLLQKIDEALNTLRPHMAIDGGNVEVVEFTAEGIVKIKWLGNCAGCSMSFMTLRAGIEQTLMSALPEVKGVEAINA